MSELLDAISRRLDDIEAAIVALSDAVQDIYTRL
jgi:hypothetical protein